MHAPRDRAARVVADDQRRRGAVLLQDARTARDRPVRSAACGQVRGRREPRSEARRLCHGRRGFRVCSGASRPQVQIAAPRDTGCTIPNAGYIWAQPAAARFGLLRPGHRRRRPASHAQLGAADEQRGWFGAHRPRWIQGLYGKAPYTLGKSVDVHGGNVTSVEIQGLARGPWISRSRRTMRPAWRARSPRVRRLSSSLTLARSRQAGAAPYAPTTPIECGKGCFPPVRRQVRLPSRQILPLRT